MIPNTNSQSFAKMLPERKCGRNAPFPEDDLRSRVGFEEEPIVSRLQLAV